MHVLTAKGLKRMLGEAITPASIPLTKEANKDKRRRSSATSIKMKFSVKVATTRHVHTERVN